MGRFPDDLSQLLDVESNMHVDDLMKGLPDDLEVVALLRVAKYYLHVKSYYLKLCITYRHSYVVVPN